MKSNIKKIWLPAIILATLSSCHTTRATVKNDAEGSTTTITITTTTTQNTDVTPSVNLNGKEK